MVAGAVEPPRIDLRNRDLVRSHVHAMWMEAARPDLGRTLTSVLDLDSTNGDGERRPSLPLPVKAALGEELRNPAHRRKARARADAVIAEVRSELDDTAWFHDGWVDEVLGQVERRFDAACDRWRTLFRAAVHQRALHHAIIGDHSRPEAERAHSRRLRAQAESQIRLLTEAEGIYEGDFYSYRYFATEGFLPGYNFPRLPISAYVPARRGSHRDATSTSRGRAFSPSPSSARARSSTTRARGTGSTRSTSISGRGDAHIGGSQLGQIPAASYPEGPPTAAPKCEVPVDPSSSRRNMKWKLSS